MPDTLTVYGQSAAIVDVLANDLDPAGGLLAVQRAVADDPDQLDVAIIDGRWLRISARQGAAVAQPAAGPLHDQQRHPLRHRGRGLGQPAPGARRTTRRSPPPTGCTVRAGTSVTAPVLDNDLSPSGDRLSLLGDVVEGSPGELEVDRRRST